MPRNPRPAPESLGGVTKARNKRMARVQHDYRTQSVEYGRNLNRKAAVRNRLASQLRALGLVVPKEVAR